MLTPAEVGAPRFDSIETAIGHTPLVELPALSPRPGVRLLAKLEGLNPSGSVKDRIARALLADLEASGRLRPGVSILEATSGNTGIALAMLARRHGHPLTVVLPDNVTQERRQLLTLYGAEIIESPGALGSNGAIALARRLAAEDDRYVMADQYANAGQPARPLRDDRAGDPGRLPGGRRLRRRAGHRRDAHGGRPPAARGQPGRAPHRRRAAAR